MINLKKDFKLFNKDKVILWSILIFMSLICLGNFIATSFGNFDSNMSETFYKSMSYKIFRGWAGYSVYDGYIDMISFIVILVLILIESFYKWKKNSNKNGWFKNHQFTLTWVCWAAGVVGILINALTMYMALFPKNGLNGVEHEFIIGYEFTIPIAVVSSLINDGLLIFMIIYLHKKVAIKPGFLESKVWRKSLNIILYIGFMYVIMGILKNTFGRPYWFNIHWNDQNIEDNPLDKLKRYYPKNYDYYMNQHDYDWGWNDGINWTKSLWPEDKMNWLWWQIGNGWAKSAYAANLPHEQAFPSGHMISVSVSFAMLTFVFNNPKSSKWLKWILVVVLGGYYLNMIFALQASTSHWWSDMMFTIMLEPLMFFVSKKLVNLVMNKSNKKWNLNL